MAEKNNDRDKGGDSLFESLMKLTGQVAEGTFDLARNTAAMTAMFGENWLRSSLLNRLEPERLEAMADLQHRVWGEVPPLPRAEWPGEVYRLR